MIINSKNIVVQLIILANQITDAVKDGKDYIVEFKEHRKKRSLNANSYMWVLVNEIANRMRLPKDKVYLQMLKDYGQKSAISAISQSDIKGFFKYYEEFGSSTLHGKEFTHYYIYKGSSEMNSLEMAILIDGVVQEAQNLGIETMTPDELANMVSLWRAND